MVRKLSILITVFFFLVGCQKEGQAPLVTKGNDSFSNYEDHFLDALWKLSPDWATGVGYHKYDSLLNIPGDKSRNAMLNFIKLQQDSLARFEANDLTELNRMDYRILRNQLEYSNWQITVLKSYQWDPTHYSAIPAFAHILNEHYAPLTKRLRNFYQKMADMPAYYKEAQKQIKNPVPELTALAIEQQTGGINIIEKDFTDSLKKTAIPAAEQKLMTDRAKIAAESIRGYISFLQNLKSDKPRSFRLGKELYEDKFRYEIQSTYTAQQLFNMATERKKQVHKEMAKLSKQLWPKYFGKKAMPADSLDMISQVLDTLSAKHTTAAALQSTIESQLPKLAAFVKSKDLLTLDPGKPLLVRKNPAYFGSAAVASLSAPGPYDKNGNSYYNIVSLTGMPADKAESYLREYNNYTLQILSIHEGIPGHYAQLVYANKAPSLIKAIFGSGAMVEGWAVYGEQMMLDNGYDDSPEMKLMWYKWHLRSVCNSILDFNVHANNLSKEQAITFLTHEAFQQKAEAEGKWKRVGVSSVQLDSYYDGYKEIMDLREAYKTKMGDKYRLKEFNEKFLSYGNAPVKLIRTAMLGSK
ncbi:DUF885 domain-containing protein [Mucilaginibacter sp. UR6-11]|uniref:DUF885 domain-containing protein n=1 Tax=Mucilaginibacter sp. UR6-11 TaxID=1435644 RepID=UPI001E5C8788|nr:DUF885 domain-containing protein [Mucilaginibacter sp. UR6-11]MCC8424146.1 DUF885 domain-containing protein [Mucilaginibacter sp. UR6-11]